MGRRVDDQGRVQELDLARQGSDDRVDRKRVIEPEVGSLVSDLVDARDPGEGVGVLGRSPEERIARVAQQLHDLAGREAEPVGRRARNPGLEHGHPIQGLGADVITGLNRRGRGSTLHVADVVVDPLLDPEADKRRIRRRLLEPETVALDNGVLGRHQPFHAGRERFAKGIPGSPDLGQRIARRPIAEGGVLGQDDVPRGGRGGSHRAPNRIVRE